MKLEHCLNSENFIADANNSQYSIVSHRITDDGRHRQYESEQVDGWSIFKESMLALLVLVELADGGGGGEDAGGEGGGAVGERGDR